MEYDYSSKKLRIRLIALGGARRLFRAQSQSLTFILPSQRSLTPFTILDIPAHGHRQPRLKIVIRLPPELLANLRRVDRVATVMPRPIRHKRLQLEIVHLSLLFQRPVISRG